MDPDACLLFDHFDGDPAPATRRESKWGINKLEVGEFVDHNDYKIIEAARQAAKRYGWRLEVSKPNEFHHIIFRVTRLA